MATIFKESRGNPQRTPARLAKRQALCRHDFERTNGFDEIGLMTWYECRHCAIQEFPPDGTLMVWADEVVCEK